MDGEEALDHAEHEPDAAFAVLEDEPAGGEAAAAPALDGFAGDVESLGDIVDGHHRFGRDGSRRFSVSLSCSTSRPRSCWRAMPVRRVSSIFRGLISGDAEDDEVVGVSFAGIDFEQKVFGRGELRKATVVGGEG